MECEFKIEDDNGKIAECVLEGDCTFPQCESIPLNPVSFPVGPPTIEGTDLKKDVDLT